MRGAMWRPTVGQKVRLSNAGYADLRLKDREEIRQSQEMTITQVEDINGGFGVPIWTIEVDQPAINRFMLDATLVEPIPEVTA